MALITALSQVPPLPAGGDRTLPPCPDTPNCVSTETARESQRVPTVPFTDAPQAALARAKAALLAEPRTTVTSERDGYLHAECTSFVFRFVDDVDIMVDSVAHVYRLRSASRVGRGDLGVNRKRIARISARLAVLPTTSN